MAEISYKIIRSKRKTLAMQITDDGVVIRAPLRAPLKIIEKFVLSKWCWAEERIKAIEHEKALLFGMTDKTVICDGKRLQVEDAELFYAEREKMLLLYATELALKFGFSVRSFKLSNAKTLWGVCTWNNDIRLNKRLVMLPLSLREYVILHELVHTLHPNHSAAFWAELKRIMPDCKSRRKELIEFAWLMRVER